MKVYFFGDLKIDPGALESPGLGGNLNEKARAGFLLPKELSKTFFNLSLIH